MSEMVLYETQKVTRTCNTERIKITSNTDVFSLKQILNIKEKVQEHLLVITLNTKNYINSIELVGIGSSQCIVVKPADVLRCALVRGSDKIILAHNHPSGDNTPSKVDIEFTNKLTCVARLYDIEILDHIIVGDECLSMRAEKLIKESYNPVLQENEVIKELKEQNSMLQEKVNSLESRCKARSKARQKDDLEM